MGWSAGGESPKWVAKGGSHKAVWGRQDFLFVEGLLEPVAVHTRIARHPQQPLVGIREVHDIAGFGSDVPATPARVSETDATGAGRTGTHGPIPDRASCAELTPCTCTSNLSSIWNAVSEALRYDALPFQLSAAGT